MPQPLPKTASLNVPQALAQALALHGQGRLAEAEPLYAAILAVRPEHVDALQMLALIRLAAGKPAEALRLVSTAMGLRTPSPQILLNQGLILEALKRHQEAVESFDRALKLKGKYAEAHNNRAAALHSLGRDEEALESCHRAIAIKRDYAEAHHNAGTSLRALGRYDAAIKSFDRALALRPNYFKAHNNLGAVLEAQNRLPQALASYERALAGNLGFVEARNNRCRVLCMLGRYDEALATFERALAFKPDDADAYYNRGRIYIDLNRNADALDDFQKALAIKPDFAEARFAACFAELPILYADESEIARRRAAYEASLRKLCADVEAGAVSGDLVEALAVKQPFLLAYQGGDDRTLQELYGGLVCRIMAQRHPASALPPLPAPGEPIRVGVVSSFFRQHSNWKIPIKGWIGQMDRARFKVFGYYLGRNRDADTEAAAAMCERFVHRPLDAAGWRREILADAPHILIYPGLLMDTVTMQLAAQRLAPVQCNSWGHPETSGMATLDYFLSSDLMEPPGADAYYTEKLIRLPNLSIYYEPVEAVPVTVTRAELGLRADAAVFWCGQSVYKYLPQHDHVFARVAQRAGHSQFVFLRHNGGPPVNDLFRARIDRAFAALGLKASDHCVFLDGMSQGKFVAAIGQCDVFLDSIEWSGCNSALESLPQCLPIVTLPGRFMRGIHSAAILRMMGMTDTIAATVDEYIAIAARLANDAAERQALRARIRENEHKVYRDRACVTALEDFLERAVRPAS